ncbi:hypothetical protein AXYL_03237 [Achromobacter xylosoxidans A8]|uniref:Uncharacterized protein n=1 Tax=Achromobacter xylosoxidans (strain A8) TaxID=762376 RepID=E3HFV1_ACHXA|nr:hypothetical protein [Achromobacter xylosoxidans]ADP16557.1 hypothetical protein AXYL_03237 [Achromobacter xylosoxidans A8]
MTKTTPSKPAQPRDRQQPDPAQHPAEQPGPDPAGQEKDQRGRWPPDSLPNPMPGLDPQQTPGIDRLDGPRLATVQSARFFHEEHV